MSPVEVVLAVVLALLIIWITYNHERTDKIAAAAMELQDEVRDLEGVKNKAARAALLKSSHIWEGELSKALHARDRAVAALSDHFLSCPPEDSFVTPEILTLARPAPNGLQPSQSDLAIQRLAQALVRLDEGLRKAREQMDATDS